MSGIINNNSSNLTPNQKGAGLKKAAWCATALFSLGAIIASAHVSLDTHDKTTTTPERSIDASFVNHESGNSDSTAPADSLKYVKPDKLATPGKTLTFMISASDLDNDSLEYSASGLPEGATFDPETQVFSWTPRYNQAGTYMVNFQVSDGKLTDSKAITITVVQLYPNWDINGDSFVNTLDMALVGQYWNQTGLTGWILEDSNEDGAVNVLDMIIVGQHWTH
jgi:hypothetical protein